MGKTLILGLMRVEGRLSGRISSADGTLIVSTGGLVPADVDVVTAKVYGTVRGDITATGRAVFDGICRMSPAAGETTLSRG